MFNKLQLEAINSNEKNIVVIAPAGAGKTTTMVGAIENFIENNLVDKVVAVTFTNKATDDLSKRLVKYSQSLEVSTIHSWSYRELKKLSERHFFRIRILEEDQIIGIIKPMLVEYSVHPKSIYAVYHHCLGNINPDLNFYLKGKYDAIAEKYIKYKRKMFLYDFTDLPLYLKTKLEEYNEFIEVDGLFVDEFQDVDPIQLSIIDRVISKKKFVIGDPLQAIYLFRGATSEIFEKLKDFKIHNLVENYRSYQCILDYAYSFSLQRPNKISDTVFLDVGKIVATRGSLNGAIFSEKNGNLLSYLKNSSNVSFESFEKISDEISQFNYTFLCRTNKEVKELNEIGINNALTIHKSKGLEYENVFLVDFEIREEEDINVGFVALTRAKNRLIVANMSLLEKSLRRKPVKIKGSFNLEKAF